MSKIDKIANDAFKSAKQRIRAKDLKEEEEIEIYKKVSKWAEGEVHKRERTPDTD